MTPFRSRLSLVYSILCAAGIAGLAYGLSQFQSVDTTRHALAQDHAEQARLRAEIANASAKVDETATRTDASEKDNQLLASALEKARQSAPATTSSLPPKPNVTRTVAEQRIRQARELGRNGDPDHALSELLWCWDEGLRALPGPTSVGMRSMITTALGELAQRHPRTREELNARFEALQSQLRVGLDGDDALTRFASLASALQRPEAVIALFDHLDESSPLRQPVAIQAFSELVVRQRYKDAAIARPIEMVTFLAERISGQTRGMREHTRKSAATDVEVLAGAGQLEPARTLAQRLLQLDDTPETRALLQQHLTRAGQPTLLQPPK